MIIRSNRRHHHEKSINYGRDGSTGYVYSFAVGVLTTAYFVTLAYYAYIRLQADSQRTQLLLNVTALDWWRGFDSETQRKVDDYVGGRNSGLLREQGMFFHPWRNENDGDRVPHEASKLFWEEIFPNIESQEIKTFIEVRGLSKLSKSQDSTVFRKLCFFFFQNKTIFRVTGRAFL